jgi:anti-anti-sigma factor
MTFQVEALEEDVRWFLLVGELDLATVERFVDRIGPVAASAGDLHLDASALTFVDSSGLNGLLRLSRMLGDHGRLFLHRPDPFVRNVLSIAGLDRGRSLLLSDDPPPGEASAAGGLAGPGPG